MPMEKLSGWLIRKAWTWMLGSLVATALGFVLSATHASSTAEFLSSPEAVTEKSSPHSYTDVLILPGSE